MSKKRKKRKKQMSEAERLEAERLEFEKLPQRKQKILSDWFTRTGMSLADFTCLKCSAKSTCPSAYDLYNTGGDCLEEK